MPNTAKATEYAPLLVAAAVRYGIAPALLAGLVEHESGWNPRARRAEVRLNDASHGLGQLLLATARGMGYAGDAEGLYDPATNLTYTARYLSEQIRRAGSVQGGLSAYNGGYRPNDGFGAPSPRAYTVVLARYQSGPRAGQPQRTRAVAVGEFANKDYVDDIMGRARSFATIAALNPRAGATSAAIAAKPAATPAPLTTVLAPTAKPAAGGAGVNVPTWAKWAGGVLLAAAAAYALT